MRTVTTWKAAAVSLETEIEQILATHFCDKDKHAVFITLMFIVGQVTFSQKTIMLKKLLKHSYPDLLTASPNLFKNLDKIRELRNKLAHSTSNVFELTGSSTEPLRTTLKSYKDGMEIS